MRRRLADEERTLVRRLGAVYRDGFRQPPDVANAHAENVEQDLPWKRDFARACHLQEVAWRWARLQEAKRG